MTRLRRTAAAGVLTLALPLPAVAADTALAAPASEHPAAAASARRSVQITRTYVGAFFDLHLRGVPGPVLDGPSAANPEVGFHP